MRTFVRCAALALVLSLVGVSAMAEEMPSSPGFKVGMPWVVYYGVIEDGRRAWGLYEFFAAEQSALDFAKAKVVEGDDVEVGERGKPPKYATDDFK